MRCLHCHRDGIPTTAEVCPQCGVHLPSLFRDVLPTGTSLRSGAYRVDYALGRGGFGVTYRAMHVALEQLVAIKEFYPQEHAIREGATGKLTVSVAQRNAYQRALERFVREGKILAGLNHSGIVRVSDLFEERGTAYLVMELVTGRTLRDELEAQPGHRLPLNRVEDVVKQLVSALEATHQAGVYHLDIKPDNVLITSSGRTVLIDFGAARQGFSGGSTQTFTLEYAAPEVMAGQTVNPASDLFELGMMAHEMLTGQRPPPALGRLLKDTWSPSGLSEPWQSLLTEALRLSQEQRPKNVRAWWERSKPAVAAPMARAAVVAQVTMASPMFTLNSNGSGDFRTLVEAIDKVSTGSTIHLKAGDYRLTAPLSISRPICIEGEGMDKTRIIWNGAGSVVRYSGEGIFTASDVTFLHEGNQWGDAIYALKGEVNFRRCRFVGGIWDKTNQRGGDGLWLSGTVTGRIETCDAVDNQGMGIRISDQARPTLVENTCHDNGWSGIAFFGQTVSNVTGNVCTGNLNNGIVVSEQAQVMLDSNISRGNKWSGISIHQGAGGAVRQNTCTGNENHGIYIGDQARPTVEGNTCQGNAWSGIGVSDEAQPTLTSNTCRGNKQSGISLWKNASGAVRQNTCAGNESHGIYVGDQARPTVEGNTCEGNTWSGIRVGDEAQPTLTSNTCQANKQSGISLWKNAGGVVRQNVCAGNEGHGICISDQARPVVESNTCQGNIWSGIRVGDEARPTLTGNICRANKQSGISLRGNAGGSVRQNTCAGNEGHGVYVGDQARPAVEGNTCQSNTWSGIGVSTAAQPTLTGNICRANKQNGIAIWENASGTMRQNTCAGNESHGIYVGDQARPAIEGNTCQGNTSCGIACFDGATGEVRNNQCGKNERGIYVADTAKPQLMNNRCSDNKIKDVDDRRY